ncbi:MAG: thiamine pyrophosphate-dependent enzyme [Candidatus Hadarchaeum sp.]|uniref:thiamine pyrophosphate-dependent enzyme n=2 Tax=Candidatus Hadarchaeum sp. TaxID=2883567 RepID=UPI0031761006
MGKSEIIIEDSPGKRVLLMGNEAIARGAIEAGVGLAASYPGTPSSEILETLAEAAPKLGFHVEWSTNEKVAFEVAAGAAITGVRSMTSMKNAGLNWVMDMFMTLVYGGVRGGFLIVVADDPDAHYSSNEQDTRFAAFYGEIPCLEPADAQEAKDMARYAFELSEQLELPVFLRSVTRISHASGDVELGKIEKRDRKPVFDKHWKMAWRWNVYGPPSAVKKHEWLHSRMPKIKEIVEQLPWNRLELKDGQNFGVIASGIGASYASDAIKLLGLEGKVAFLKIGTPTPLPEKLVARLLKAVDTVLVVEEGEPLVELLVKTLAKDTNPKVKILGKLTGEMPQVGEINIDVVASAVSKILGREIPVDPQIEKTREEVRKLVVPRSSTLCAGCPHLGTYWALKRALLTSGGTVPIVNGDIGCYEQGGYGIAGKEYKPSFSTESVRYKIEAPYETLDTNYIMGGGVGLMQGEYHAGYRDGSVVAVAGDSTFFHACLPAVVNAVYNKSKGLFIVMDNSWTAMTGHQPNPVTGITATGSETKSLRVEDVAKALGVEFIRVVDPFDLKATQSAIEEGLKSDKFAIVVTRRICTLQAIRLKQYSGKKMTLDKDTCTGCRLCVSIGCPAITFNVDENKAGIDPIICVGCGICAQVCPVNAIKVGE